MQTMADRFRHWYDYERHANAQTLTMLDSVPADGRAAADFQRAVDLMAHMIRARRMWLHRLGAWPEVPGGWNSDGSPLAELPALLRPTEAAWVAWLGRLDDATLAADLEWTTVDGKRYRWPVEAILTQVSGHAWYHRGQIAQLVKDLGGKTVSTDYYFWRPPTTVAPPERGSA